MEYEVELKPKSIKDLKKLDKKTRMIIINKIEALKNDLTGDIKHLTNFSPEYCLRVGDYRVLFEIENDNFIVIYRVRHRKEVYKT